MKSTREAHGRMARFAVPLLLSCAAVIAFASGAAATDRADRDGRADRADRADRAEEVEPAGEPLVVALDFVVPEYLAGAKFRSPATIDTALAEDLAKRLGRPLAVTGRAPAGVVAAAGGASSAVSASVARNGESARTADLWIKTIADLRSVPEGYAAIALDYRAAPMAIMRTDSSIRRWEHLRDRTVCLAEGGNHLGELARRYGAVEIVHPSPTDALVAVRIGACDVMVHDSVMLEELIKFPEWKKFSRRLPPQPRSTLAILVPEGDAEMSSRVRTIAADWKADGFAGGLVRNVVRNIAFEVYLEQEVPDCH